MLLHHSYSPPPPGFHPLADNGLWTFGYFLREGTQGESWKVYQSVLSKYVVKKSNPLDTLLEMYKNVYGEDQ